MKHLFPTITGLGLPASHILRGLSAKLNTTSARLGRRRSCASSENWPISFLNFASRRSDLILKTTQGAISSTGVLLRDLYGSRGMFCTYSVPSAMTLRTTLLSPPRLGCTPKSYQCEQKLVLGSPALRDAALSTSQVAQQLCGQLAANARRLANYPAALNHFLRILTAALPRNNTKHNPSHHGGITTATSSSTSVLQAT